MCLTNPTTYSLSLLVSHTHPYPLTVLHVTLNWGSLIYLRLLATIGPSKMSIRSFPSLPYYTINVIARARIARLIGAINLEKTVKFIDEQRTMLTFTMQKLFCEFVNSWREMMAVVCQMRLKQIYYSSIWSPTYFKRVVSFELNCYQQHEANRERDEKRTENKIKTKKSFPPAKARMEAKSFCWLLLNSITFLPNFGV